MGSWLIECVGSSLGNLFVVLGVAVWISHITVTVWLMLLKDYLFPGKHLLPTQSILSQL